MKRIDLSSFSLYEKYECIQDNLGDYGALQELTDLMDAPGSALEKLVIEFNQYDEAVGEDMIAWYLEGSSGFEALDFYKTLQDDVEDLVDRIMIKWEMDTVEETETYNEWCAWRNR